MNLNESTDVLILEVAEEEGAGTRRSVQLDVVDGGVALITDSPNCFEHKLARKAIIFGILNE